jgi:hypothetical protein
MVLDRHYYVGEVILRCILLCDEMLIYHCETESKHQTME